MLFALAMVRCTQPGVVISFTFLSFLLFSFFFFFWYVRLNNFHVTRLSYSQSRDLFSSRNFIDFNPPMFSSRLVMLMGCI